MIAKKRLVQHSRTGGWLRDMIVLHSLHNMYDVYEKRESWKV